MSEDTVEKLALVALGWLLGLLGPIITEEIKRRRENALGRDALLSELREVGCLLGVAAYGVHMNRGTVDREFLAWLKKDLEQYAVSSQFQIFIPNLTKQLEFSDEEILAGARHMASGHGMSTVLQRYPVPLLDSRVSALWTFDTSFQRGLLSIRTSIQILDDLVNRTHAYHDMTFSKHEGDNHERIVGNIGQACDLYAQRAIRTVKLIRQFTSEEK